MTLVFVFFLISGVEFHNVLDLRCEIGIEIFVDILLKNYIVFQKYCFILYTLSHKFEMQFFFQNLL